MTTEIKHPPFWKDGEPELMNAYFAYIERQNAEVLKHCNSYFLKRVAKAMSQDDIEIQKQVISLNEYSQDHFERVIETAFVLAAVAADREIYKNDKVDLTLFYNEMRERIKRIN